MQATDTARDAADLDLVLSAARQAGDLAMGYFGQKPEVWLKAGSSPVSEADFAVDRFLRETLSAARPDYGWLSEETADTPDRLSAQRTFVVDPIDGTRAFLEGRDTWCVSVAVVEAGTPVAGVLVCPALKETYWASSSGPALLDGEPIEVRSRVDKPRVGGPKTIFNMLPEALRDRFSITPYVPSLAYRLALLARGGLDAALVKPDSHDWDLAAADLILRQAGGRVVDEHGNALSYAGEHVRHQMLVAGSGALLAEILDAFAARRLAPVSNTGGMV